MDVLNFFRDRPAGTLRLNVPASAARLVLPSIVPRFIAAYPDILVEVIAEESFVDLLSAGCDAGIRYEERLEQDMIAVPIGPPRATLCCGRVAFLFRRIRTPRAPRDLLSHACLRIRFPSGAIPVWEFEREGEVVKIDPPGPLVVSAGTASDLVVEAAIAGSGIVGLFADWLLPYFKNGSLEPVLEPWWQRFFRPVSLLSRAPLSAGAAARLR